MSALEAFLEDYVPTLDHIVVRVLDPTLPVPEAAVVLAMGPGPYVTHGGTPFTPDFRVGDTVHIVKGIYVRSTMTLEECPLLVTTPDNVIAVKRRA